MVPERIARIRNGSGERSEEEGEKREWGMGESHFAVLSSCKSSWARFSCFFPPDATTETAARVDSLEFLSSSPVRLNWVASNGNGVSVEWLHAVLVWVSWSPVPPDWPASLIADCGGTGRTALLRCSRYSTVGLGPYRRVRRMEVLG